ncbi:MAG: hypothetical protein HZB43_03180 [candidate division Zixibacteria bacterium]|nr:hypothetical protein [candidate division Zixibacteria bacterium]
MKNLNELGSTPLTWVQPKAFRREFELQAADEPVARIQWETAFGSLVSVQTSEGRWLIKRFGLFWRQGSISREGDAGELATFTFGWFGRARLDTQRADHYFWARSGFWLPTWTFTNSSGFPVARFRLSGFFLKSKGEIEVCESAQLHQPDLPLLLLIGWYLVLVIQRRSRRR